MEITDVRVTAFRDQTQRLLGIASIVIDDSIAIHDIRILRRDGKLLIAMPERKKRTGDFCDIVHPINAPARAKICDAILEEYEQETARQAAKE